jgi:outer membrane lipoprotein-sorting protein
LKTLVALLLLVPALAAAGPRALLDHALRTTRDAGATFRQTRTDALGETVTEGTLAYRKPRRLRLEWRGKAGATAFVNRDTVWFYQPGQKQVLKSRASAGGAPPALFLEESVDVLDRAYRVKEEGATGLVLEPRAAGSPWRRMKLALDPVSGWPKSLVLEGKGGESTRLDFGRFKVNAGVPAAKLAPSFPQGTTVIEL